jgi:hypothetical protein
MAAARPVRTSVASSESGSPANGEDAPIPNEVSPLLNSRRTKAQTIPERWRTTRTSFLEDNAGLLLVAAAQFFFSAMGIAVKWLNSLDDPVPTLEV